MLLNSKMIGLLVALLALFIAVGVAEEERAGTSGQSTHLELQVESLPMQLPDMNTEAGIREYLVGEWHFYDSSFPGYKSCRMVIDEDLNAEFTFYSGLEDELRRFYSGQFSYDRIYADAHEAPDLLCLELSDSMLLGGDYFFLHRTVVDECRIMSLFSAGNGGCVFDFLDQSVEDGWGNSPVEIRFYTDTGEEYQLAPRLNAAFHAVYWGYGDAEEGMWLDDIHWPPPGPYDLEQIGSDTWYRYLTTSYDNELPVSVVYATTDDMVVENDGDLRDGEVYLVKTNEHGAIVSMLLVSESGNNATLTGKYSFVSMETKGETVDAAALAEQSMDDSVICLEFAGNMATMFAFGETIVGTYKADGKNIEITTGVDTVKGTLDGNKITITLGEGEVLVVEKK